MQVLKLLFRNLDHYRKRFLALFFIAFLDGIALFFIPLALAEFTRSPLALGSFWELATVVTVSYAISLACQWLLRRYGEALSGEVSIYLRRKYFHSLTTLPYSRLTKHHSAYVLSLVAVVSDGLGGLTNELLWGIAKSLSTMLLFFAYTARESIGIALLNFLLLTVFIVVSTKLSQRMVPLARNLNLTRATLLERYADFLSNILTVRKLAVSGFAERTIEQSGGSAIDQIHVFQRFHAGRWLILHSLFGLTFLSTILFLLWQVSSGVGSPSTIILFVAAYATIRGQVERLSEDFKTVLEMTSFIESLHQVVTPAELVSEVLPPASFREITLRNIEFQYPGNASRITIPEFQLRSGEKILISGISGQGKTTLLNILAGLLDPLSGERLLNGEKISADTSPTFSTQMTFVAQEVELFNLSLRENLTLGTSIPDAELLLLIKQVGLREWLEALEDGLNTVVGEKGLRLSAGQKQRINLLRGLLLDRPVLLLDEPTAHLDATTEARVVELLGRALLDRSAVIVSHRPALRVLCTKHYEMREGELHEVKS